MRLTLLLILALGGCATCPCQVPPPTEVQAHEALKHLTRQAVQGVQRLTESLAVRPRDVTPLPDQIDRAYRAGVSRGIRDAEVQSRAARGVDRPVTVPCP
jgi:hypothetical protein